MFGSDSSFIIHRSSLNYGQIQNSTTTSRRPQDELWAQGADFLYSADYSFLFAGCIRGADCASVGAGEGVGGSASVDFTITSCSR
jgi:hypothetical protein